MSEIYICILKMLGQMLVGDHCAMLQRLASAGKGQSSEMPINLFIGKSEYGVHYYLLGRINTASCSGGKNWREENQGEKI